MAEHFSVLKTALKKKKNANISTPRSSLHFGSTPNLTSRKSSLSHFKEKKITSASAESLNLLSEEEAFNHADYEKYELEYSTYLLRKLQNNLLEKSKKEKENNVKNCFVLLKQELEYSLNKFVQLSSDLTNLKMCFDTIQECQNKIDLGRKILKIMGDNKMDVLLMSLSSLLDHTVNQLQLVGIHKSQIDDAFTNKVLGPDSQLNEYLNKINASIEEDKEKILEIASELSKIEELCQENSILRQRYHSVLDSLLKDILEIGYDRMTNVVNKAFVQRKELRRNGEPLHDYDLFDLQQLLQPRRPSVFSKLMNSPLNFKLDSLCSQPRSSSTPNPL